MIANDFWYNDQYLSDFNLIMCMPEDEQDWARRDIDRSDITPIRPIPNFYSVKYSDTLVLHFLIIKCDEKAGTADYMKMDGEFIDELMGWLTSPKRHMLLTTISDEDFDVNYYGLFTDVQPYVFNGECYGLKLTFTCNAPYGFSDIFEQEYSMDNLKTKSVKYFCESSEKYAYIYPVIKVDAASTTFGSSATFTLSNDSDSSYSMSFTLPSGASSITIDCDKKRVLDQSGNVIPLTTLISQDAASFLSTPNYSFNWFRILPSENNLQISSNKKCMSKVTIQARGVIKAGGF